jgi:hypothetical protein
LGHSAALDLVSREGCEIQVSSQRSKPLSREQRLCAHSDVTRADAALPQEVFGVPLRARFPLALLGNARIEEPPSFGLQHPPHQALVGTKTPAPRVNLRVIGAPPEPLNRLGAPRG